MHTINSTCKLLFKYKKHLFIANILAILAVIANTPIPLIIPMLIDEVLLNKPGFIIDSATAIFKNPSMLTYIFFAFFLTILLRGIFFILNYYQTKIFTQVSKKVTFEIRKSALMHLEKISLSEYEFFGHGKVASLLVTDVETVDEFISSIASHFITSILHIIFIATILCFISWQIAVLIFILNPVIVYITTKLSKIVAQYKKEQNQAYQKFQEEISETLNQFVQIKASNQEKNFIENLINKSNILRDKSSVFTYKRFFANHISISLFMISTDIIRVIAILAIAFYDNMSIGQIIAVFSYLWMSLRPMEYLANIQYSYHSAKMALNRINSILSLKQEPQFLHVENPFKDKKTNSIELKNIQFSYNDKVNILENINIKIEEGEKIAFVGKSGGGKTTLAQIIVGFYPFSSGDIFFNDISIKNIGLDVVRENVFLVLQNPQLFNDTIRQNLTLGKNIQEEDIWEALKKAQLYNFISTLQDKLETVVGNHGMRLSGGQRQRLAIARMILKNPNIVILDESTSALDNKTEAKLFDSIKSFLEPKTTIIIAHRLNTIKNVDRIFLFNNGKIKVLDSYEDLLRKEGYVKK